MQTPAATAMPRTTRRGRPTQAEAVEKRSAIIGAATRLFLAVGYRDASIRQVAELAEVSTRTVYNLFEDKASLFSACLDSISPDADGSLLVEKDTLEATLTEFAVKMVRMLSGAESLGFARLVMSDGKDLAELASAGYAKQQRQFVQPLSKYLAAQLQDRARCDEWARLFIALAISEWNRSVTFHLPLPDAESSIRHARNVTALFLHGVMGAGQNS